MEQIWRQEIYVQSSSASIKYNIGITLNFPLTDIFPHIYYVYILHALKLVSSHCETKEGRYPEISEPPQQDTCTGHNKGPGRGQYYNPTLVFLHNYNVL